MLTHVLMFFCGTGVFLFGISRLSGSVTGYGNRLISKRFKEKLDNGLFALSLGAFVTGIVQSSAATNTTAIKLYDNNLIDRKTSYYLIMGANIGTTVTAYIALLSDISMTSIIMMLIFPAIIVSIATKNGKLDKIAQAVCFTSLIFVGLYLVNSNIGMLREPISRIISNNSNKILLFFIAMLLTAVLSSSSLVSVLLISLASNGIIGVEAALFMVMGINIGGSPTIILTSLGSQKEGKYPLLFNFFFNSAGAVIQLFMLATHMLDFFIRWNISLELKIALYHTFFNTVATLFFFFFIPELARYPKGASSGKRKAFRVIS